MASGPRDRHRPLVLGVGDPAHRDDAVGLLVAERLRSLGLGEVDVRPHSRHPEDLVAGWRGRSLVVLVDALRTGSAPGTLHRLVIDGSTPVQLDHPSSHGGGIAAAIELARWTRSLPERLVVLGVEPGDLRAGRGVTPAVRQAVDHVVRAVVAELRVAREGTAGRNLAAVG